MAIIATGGDGGKTFTPAPNGTHQAVCCDVIDKGLMEETWDGKVSQKHKIDLVWQVAETREDGTRYLVFKRYTLSLGEKANLRHDLESWWGRSFTEQELAGFDVETVKGANCLLNIIQKPSKKNPGRIYANVASIMPLVKGMVKIAPLNYTRPVDKQPAVASQPEPEPDPEREDYGNNGEDELEPIPF